VVDLRHGFEPYRGHEIFEFFVEARSPQIELPAVPPPLGLAWDSDAALKAIA
jgi:hypothetical protein